jgi:hypothetical protein
VPTSRGPEIGGAIGALVGGLGLGAAGAAIGSLFCPVGIAVGLALERIAGRGDAGASVGAVGRLDGSGGTRSLHDGTLGVPMARPAK